MSEPANAPDDGSSRQDLRLALLDEMIATGRILWQAQVEMPQLYPRLLRTRHMTMRDAASYIAIYRNADVIKHAYQWNNARDGKAPTRPREVIRLLLAWRRHRQ